LHSVVVAKDLRWPDVGATERALRYAAIKTTVPTAVTKKVATRSSLGRIEDVAAHRTSQVLGNILVTDLL
jgi:hypothetical protein